MCGINFFQSVISYWFVGSTSALLWSHCRSEKKDYLEAEALASFISEAGSNVVNKPKIALETQLTFLHRSRGFCIPSAKKEKNPNQNQSSPCATRLRAVCVFGKVSMFQQPLQVFGARGKRSSRWLPFGRQRERRTGCFVSWFLRDLSTADDSGSAPAFARACALVRKFFYRVC